MPSPKGPPEQAASASFDDRRAAGRLLAQELSEYGGRDDVVVLGLPRGGVPVAYEVAAALRLPLDVLLVRKLGVPGQEELAFGAIASGGVRVLNADVVAVTRSGPDAIKRIASERQRELERLEELYREGRPPLELRDRTALVVDDGLATGATMRAAVAAVRQLGATPVVAVPVAAREGLATLAQSGGTVVCTLAPERFVAVGHWYRDFSPTRDAEVRALLSQARR